MNLWSLRKYCVCMPAVVFMFRQGPFVITDVVFRSETSTLIYNTKCWKNASANAHPIHTQWVVVRLYNSFSDQLLLVNVELSQCVLIVLCARLSWLSGFFQSIVRMTHPHTSGSEKIIGSYGRPLRFFFLLVFADSLKTNAGGVEKQWIKSCELRVFFLGGGGGRGV